MLALEAMDDDLFFEGFEILNLVLKLFFLGDSAIEIGDAALLITVTTLVLRQNANAVPEVEKLCIVVKPDTASAARNRPKTHILIFMLLILVLVIKMSQKRSSSIF